MSIAMKCGRCGRVYAADMSRQDGALCPRCGFSGDVLRRPQQPLPGADVPDDAPLFDWGRPIVGPDR